MKISIVENKGMINNLEDFKKLYEKRICCEGTTSQ
jgi:hypothetical protein